MNFSHFFLSQDLQKDADSKIEMTLRIVSFLKIYKATRTKKIGAELNLVYFPGMRSTRNVHTPCRPLATRLHHRS